MNSDRRGFFGKLFGLGAMVVAAPALEKPAAPIIKPGSAIIFVHPNYAPVTFTSTGSNSSVVGTSNYVWYEVK